MSEDEQLEMLINQTLNGAISTIPDHMENIEKNKELLKIEDAKEFVYGMIIGMAFGMSSALITTQKGIPTEEDQLKIREIIYKNVDDIRDKIFK
ncbi:MAG: hypothetical protein GWN01_09640 [Nitrosopumilaceae archaeon]|nr:hypothetical protein [Nitrosopumilaceae archaeon]NIU01167.1 hypothetical protein [Nitrosopumilaceae archaeon]NIU87536.1 hypothetical protein [Nitrosopumilaceae archaeon]NIV66001.1 hypothetical protein [Nitrosopumilaceae archaeon]NIX61769.1 hypothetical protein [Nitrosopumilaceae archaeon]